MKKKSLTGVIAVITAVVCMAACSSSSSKTESSSLTESSSKSDTTTTTTTAKESSSEKETTATSKESSEQTTTTAASQSNLEKPAETETKNGVKYTPGELKLKAMSADGVYYTLKYDTSKLEFVEGDWISDGIAGIARFTLVNSDLLNNEVRIRVKAGEKSKSYEERLKTVTDDYKLEAHEFKLSSGMKGIYYLEESNEHKGLNGEVASWPVHLATIYVEGDSTLTPTGYKPVQIDIVMCYKDDMGFTPEQCAHMIVDGLTLEK